MTHGVKKSRFAVVGALALLLGLWPILIAFDIIHVPPDSIRAPRWVLAAAGVAFLLAGCMALLQAHQRLLDALAGVLLVVFCAVGVWAAFFAPPEDIRGGFFFLSQEANARFGKVLFGLGAVMTFAYAVYAFRLAIKGHR